MAFDGGGDVNARRQRATKTTARIELQRRTADSGWQTTVSEVVDIPAAARSLPSLTMFSMVVARRHCPNRVVVTAVLPSIILRHCRTVVLLPIPTATTTMRTTRTKMRTATAPAVDHLPPRRRRRRRRRRRVQMSASRDEAGWQGQGATMMGGGGVGVEEEEE